MKNKKRRDNIDKGNSTPIVEKVDKSPIIHQKSKIKTNLRIFERPDLTETQRDFLNLALNKDVRMLFVSGPAGTTKSYLAVYAALRLLNDRKISDLIYIRSAVESADSHLGFLPGLISDKMHPYIQPLIDKLEELIPKNEIDLLTKEQRIVGMPINFLRGLNFNAKAIIGDEFQNCTYKEILTFITRAGEFSKVFILGDPDQSDIGNKSGFIKMMEQFDDDESKSNGIYTFKFDETDILRSGLVRYIITKLNKLNKKPL